jgi:hypothetical protein
MPRVIGGSGGAVEGQTSTVTALHDNVLVLPEGTVVAVPPAPILPNPYVKTARILSSRQDLLPFLPKNAVFCEVGVAYGDFTAEVLRVCTPKKFIAVDCFDLEKYPSMWGFSRLEGRSHEEFYRRRFEQELGSGRMELMRGFSNVTLPLLLERSVDIFYIDAWHSYEAVSEELDIIKTKVTPLGWIVLNDYTLYDVVSETAYGVIQAAHEFMLAEGWEMKFLALHPLMFCDIALRKMKLVAPASPPDGRGNRNERGLGKVRRGPAEPTAKRRPRQGGPDRPEPPAAAVRLVIWDTDDLCSRRDTVIALARRGIMSSICAMGDDAAAMREMLELAGIWDYLIFPSIDWTAKAQRVAAIVDAAEVAAPSVMLFDNNPTDRSEIAALLPGLRIGDAMYLSRILADPSFQGEDDQELTRLARYKRLESRDAERHDTRSEDGAQSPPSSIQVLVEPDVAAHLDRVIELISGTRRLNFTKRRLPDSIAEARQQLRREIAPYYVRTGLIRVIDQDEDYGYCGFYRIIESELADYCFSHVIHGLGVESWLYERLGRPKLAMSGEGPFDSCRPQGSDRITLISSGDHDCRLRAGAIPEVRLRGGHEVAALAHYFRLVAGAVAAETNEYRGALFLQLDSSTLALPAFGDAPPGFYEAVMPLGLTAADFASKFFTPAPPGSVLVYSTWGDLYLPIYRHKKTGVTIPVTVDIYEDLTSIADDALARALVEVNANDFTTRRIKEIAAALRTDYTWEPRLSLAEAAAIVRTIFERIPEGTRLFFMLPCEWAKWKNALQPRTEAIEYNAAIRELAHRYPGVTLLATTEVVTGPDEMLQGFDLFDRIVYFRLYQQIMHAIGAGLPAAPEIDAGVGAPARNATPAAS